jgi:protein TonB
MKRIALLPMVVAGPVCAQGGAGYVNTPSAPPPTMSVPSYPAPSSVIRAVPGVPPPMQIVAVPAMPPPPIIAYPAVPLPRPVPVPASELARGPQPRAAPQSLVRPDDYPPAALAIPAEGRVAFVLTIGPDGRVSECTVTRSSGSIALDAATCRIMRSRGRFTPAMDRHGNPAIATIAQEVVWKLPYGRFGGGFAGSEQAMIPGALPPMTMPVRFEGSIATTQ